MTDQPTPLPVTVLGDVPHQLYWHEPARTADDDALKDFPFEAACKTLAFDVDGDLVLVGIPGPARLAYPAVAQALGVSRRRVQPAAAERLEPLGMEPGGICPFTNDPSVKVLLDNSLRAIDPIYTGGGDNRLTVELTPDALAQALPQAVWGDFVQAT